MARPRIDDPDIDPNAPEKPIYIRYLKSPASSHARPLRADAATTDFALPLALEGSSLYSPLAWVIIGGMISSTILARLVTPVMYRLLAPAVEVRAAA